MTLDDLKRAITQAERGSLTDLGKCLRALTAGDNLIVEGQVIALGTPRAHQGDLSTSADGTAIAAAVNGLRDDLIAFGIMSSS